MQAERLPDGALAAVTEQRRSHSATACCRARRSWRRRRSSDGPPPDMSDYLALPKNYPPRVSDLARAVAGRRPSLQYDQALALEAYLRELPYSYEVQPLPRSGDAVEQFLFDMRQGYCTYYASAMAVMARSLGIPARVAIGYATGEYDPGQRRLYSCARPTRTPGPSCISTAAGCRSSQLRSARCRRAQLPTAKPPRRSAPPRRTEQPDRPAAR